MPIYDTEHYTQSGRPMSSKERKYTNVVGEDGKTVNSKKAKKLTSFENFFAIMENQNRIETYERYMWTNVPPGLTPDLIERVLFYRGKGVLYFDDEVGRFMFLPFALNDTIDVYGRYTRCNSLPFTGVDKEGKDAKQSAVKEDIEIVYDLPYNEEMLKKIQDGECVGIILNDSSLAIGQQPVIRSMYVRPVLTMMASLMQIINCAMYGCADHNLIQVQNESEVEDINEGIKAINDAIATGDRFTVVTGAMPIVPIKTSNTIDLEGLFNTFNSLSNFLKSITGVANPGIFDKKAHLLQEEQALNGSNADDIYYNGLRMRQEFCLLVQAYYNYPIWCESKRGMSGVQAENMATGETSDPDNTQYNDEKGGQDNASDRK